ncbi:TIGR02678 family protein [Peribacillus simplex]|uniref:TIGR02678 family protein n=1 Tax=Peribacillus simplex TaxID=1478 RepID=UPI0024C20BB0|nr:TIGR02678 family protein [Peribacillus simplex]WHX89019.1 TIGR02678 family protein [Peribacillus simplex]
MLYEEELEFDKKFQVKPFIKDCIFELLERFWVLKETDESLFYQIKDHEVEIKKYFRETFHYRLISNHELVKLEKIPVVAHSWMGEKTNKSVSVFKSSMDYAFFFWLLAFLEGKNVDQQFTLQNICEYFQVQEHGQLVWKDGVGYQNRLSLVRVMKYAVKMTLLKVEDQEIDDFSGDDSHDVLLQRTPYSSYFMRMFSEDISSCNSLSDFMAYLDKENQRNVDRKHRYYRRLFLEPIVYHKEMAEEDQEYVKNYYSGVENHLYRYTDFTYERYNGTSLLLKEEAAANEKIYPTDNMVIKISMLFGNYLYQRPFAYPFNEDNKLELSMVDVDNIFSELKKEHRQYWTKKLRQAKVEDLRIEVINEMKKWMFVEEREDTFIIKEGLFRIVGEYYLEK